MVEQWEQPRARPLADQKEYHWVVRMEHQRAEQWAPKKDNEKADSMAETTAVQWGHWMV